MSMSPMVTRTSDDAFTAMEPNWDFGPSGCGAVERPGFVVLPGGSEPTCVTGPTTAPLSVGFTPVVSGGRESIAAPVLNGLPNVNAAHVPRPAIRSVAMAAPDHSRRLVTGFAAGLLGMRAPEDVGVVSIVT